jgi:hypothetical protein
MSLNDFDAQFVNQFNSLTLETKQETEDATLQTIQEHPLKSVRLPLSFRIWTSSNDTDVLQYMLMVYKEMFPVDRISDDTMLLNKKSLEMYECRFEDVDSRKNITGLFVKMAIRYSGTSVTDEVMQMIKRNVTKRLDSHIQSFITDRVTHNPNGVLNHSFKVFVQIQ